MWRREGGGGGWLYANTKTITDMSWDSFHFTRMRGGDGVGRPGWVGSTVSFDDSAQAGGEHSYFCHFKTGVSTVTAVTSRLVCP